MKQTITLLLLLFCFIVSAGTYGQVQIRGKIVSVDIPVAFANVLLLSSKDSSLVKGTLTNEAGSYLFTDVKAGQYLMVAHMVGYKKAYSPAFSILSTTADLALNTLNIEQDSKQLHEVLVAATKPLFEQQIDRMVVNVQSSITAVSGTVLQVLERSPGIKVDHYNSSISMSGKNGVQVMINGKLNRMPMESLYQLLSSMPANNITQIELITTPPANLDAEGNGGYINILLRKNEAEGLNGSFFVNAEKRRRFNNALGADINFRKNKFSLFANYNFTYERRLWFVDVERHMNHPNKQYEFKSQATRKGGADINNIRLVIDYQLSPKTIVGFLTSAFDRNWAQFTNIQATYNLYAGTDSLINGFRKDKNPSEQYMANVNLKHSFTDQQQVNFDLDYFYNHSSQPQNYVFDYKVAGDLRKHDEIRLNKDTPMNIWVAKADYNWKANGRLNIETGVKATYSEFSNRILMQTKQDQEWLMIPDFSEEAEMEEQVGAASGQFSYKINKATDLKAGLRYEYTDTKLTSQRAAPITRKYGSLFPTLFFSKKLNADNTWQLSYNRRITRPSFSDLAPYVLFLDPATYITGNSYLKPAFIHSVKTDYTYKSFIFSFQASRAHDAIYSFQPQANLNSNTTVYSAINIDREDTYVISFTLPLTITAWWQAQNNLLAMRQMVETDLQEKQFDFSQNSISLNSSHTFKLPQKFSLELTGFYNSPVINGINKTSNLGSINIGIRKELNHNRGRLNLSFSDIFRTNIIEWQSNQPEQSLLQLMRLDIDAKSVKLVYTKNFGSQQVKGARKRTTGSAEEQKRL